METLTNFKQKMSEYDINPPDEIIMDDNIHRFETWGDSAGSMSGAYSYNGRFGWFQDWRTMDKPKIVGANLSKADEEVITKSLKGGRKRISRKRLEADITRIWDAGDDAAGHPYLNVKKIDAPPNVKQYDDNLIVPVMGANKQLNGLQRIDANGRKRFLSGTRKKASMFGINGHRKTIVICEGFATGVSIYQSTGYSVAVAFDAGNLLPVAKAVSSKEMYETIIIAGDNDSWKEGHDKPNTGATKAREAAIAVSARLALPNFQKPDGKNTTDFNDLMIMQSPEEVKAQIESALQPELSKTEELRAEVEKLANLDPLELALERNRISEKYKISKSAIDQYTHNKNRQEENNKEKIEVVEDIEPYQKPVDGAKLLDHMESLIRRYLVIPQGGPEVMAGWNLLSYCYDAFMVFPKLSFISPGPRCGKTTALDLIAALSHKALKVDSITPAAVFRTIELYHPTLITDEADTYLKGNDELRGILNSGHRRNSRVIRLVGEKHEPQSFSTWCPNSIAMIGKLPETLKDRSIVINLKRRTPDEHVEKFPVDFNEQCLEIRQRCKRWAIDNFETLKEIRPIIVPSGNDRADDNWFPLFALAKLVGDNWPEKLQEAHKNLVDVHDEDSIGIKILTDIKDVFEDKKTDRFFSERMVEELRKIEESPWDDWNYGKGLSKNGLARLLRPYGIRPKTIRGGTETKKGYQLDQFEDAFRRYLSSDPPDQTVTTSQPATDKGLRVVSDRHTNKDVTFENPWKPTTDKTCDGVTDESEGCDDDMYLEDEVII